MPQYDLSDVKEAARQENIEYRGRKVRRDIDNLSYELVDVAQCLMQLSTRDFRKTVQYEDGRPPDDEYICKFVKAGNEDMAPDELYIKLCLVEDCLLIDLSSFHLTRFG